MICTNVRPIYEKVEPFDKKTYGPVSELPLLSKVYERVIYKQTSNYFEPFLNEILCRFRKKIVRSMLYSNYWHNGKLC